MGARIPTTLAAFLAVLSVLAAAFLPLPLEAADTAPAPRQEGKWRIAYVEGGTYENYQKVLKSFVRGLEKLGWIQADETFHKTSFPDDRAMWAWLSQNARSDYLEFVPDAFWSANWEETARERNKDEAINRLRERRDIDAVIAMGTWAGQDLANDRHSTPVIVFQSSDAVKAGIVKSAQYSGRPHVFALCDPARYKRQVSVFHDIVHFRKLGVTFEDSPTGRIYAAIDDVKDVCREQGVELVECHAVTNSPDFSQAVASFRACNERLAKEADAVLITHSMTVKPSTMPELFKPFLDAKIPTFAQMGSGAVRRGALLSLSQTDFKAIGLFYARAFSQILRGASPGSLPQVFEDPPVLAVNLETAKRIGFNPPSDVLAESEEVFTSILTQDSQ
ncbi:ABC transporter substrate-binding protein [Fundidesulfovibrio terrae]|uniref:ABC transporter substrate-binding protein n=1 Tax=Fundidesulfovibrio terrae TaxID=2922866 RepID=UPI001FAECFD0|nr:ABC transporter substrate binding protein [Fundidesulfovibrio terrae]